ncbi:hypothetical protein QAD02_011904 [Eretmocerus hayati]|uniref:Uncharacterized protein n=1 Tax=Eretmocerus hayati TaxID=131215 RepID=A0ACC2NY21_9HYME|nr:hypothetical protein QAD02_011904 [Eretmocerus hayati]
MSPSPIRFTCTRLSEEPHTLLRIPQRIDTFLLQLESPLRSPSPTSSDCSESSVSSSVVHLGSFPSRRSERSPSVICLESPLIPGRDHPFSPSSSDRTVRYAPPSDCSADFSPITQHNRRNSPECVEERVARDFIPSPISPLSSPDVSSFLTPPISPEDFSNFLRCVNGNNVNPVIQPDHHFDDQMNVLQPSVNHIAEPIQNALNIPVIASASNGLVYDNQALYYTDAVSSRQQQQQQQLARVEIYQPNNGDDTIDDSSLFTVAYVIPPSRQEQLVAEQCLVQYVTQTAPSVEPHANAIREPQMEDFHNDVNINRETLIECSHSNIIQGDESQIDENQADESNSTATLYRGECQYNWSMQPHQYYRGGQGKPWRHMLNLERATREQRFYDRRLNRSFARGGFKKIDIEDETMQTEDKTTGERMMVPGENGEVAADQNENMEVQQNENMQAESNDIEAEKIETEKMEKIEAEQEKLEIENKKMETAEKKKI